LEPIKFDAVSLIELTAVFTLLEIDEVADSVVGIFGIEGTGTAPPVKNASIPTMA
jgi:hypothetical protein